MTRQATHFGHCQLCGREQKLPGDRLSLHGYTVEWSAFHGTCPGASHLPYEQSAGLLEAARDSARLMASNLRDAADRVEKLQNAFWAQEWVGRKGRVGGYYEWHCYGLDRLTFRSYGNEQGGQTVYFANEYRDDDGKRHDTSLYGERPKPDTAESIAAILNHRRAEAIRAEAAEYDRYADWADARFKAFKPEPLRPVVAEVETPVDIKVVYNPRHYGHKFEVVEGPDAIVGRYFVSERAAENAARKALA